MDEDKLTTNNVQTNPVWIILILLIILALIGLGFWYWYKNFYENSWQDRPQPVSHLTSESKTSITPTNTGILEIIDVLDENNSLVYDNRAYGYTISYPKDWNSVNSDDQEAENVDFSSATDKFDGAVVSISVSEKDTDYDDIKKWSESRPVGDPEGAKAKESTEYVEEEDSGMTFAKTQTPEYKLLTYQWICGGNVMTLSYMASGPDYDAYMPTFEAMFDSLVPCAG